jgi:hypothetical protein
MKKIIFGMVFSFLFLSCGKTFELGPGSLTYYLNGKKKFAYGDYLNRSMVIENEGPDKTVIYFSLKGYLLEYHLKTDNVEEILYRLADTAHIENVYIKDTLRADDAYIRIMEIDTVEKKVMGTFEAYFDGVDITKGRFHLNYGTELNQIRIY